MHLRRHLVDHRDFNIQKSHKTGFFKAVRAQRTTWHCSTCKTSSLEQNNNWNVNVSKQIFHFPCAVLFCSALASFWENSKRSNLGFKETTTSQDKDRGHLTGKIIFNGPKFSEQLSVHSWKEKKWEDMTKKSSHLEFHSIFNQDGITNSPKNLQFQRAKKGKTSSPTEVFKNLFKCVWKRPEHLKAGLFLLSFTKNRWKRQIENKRKIMKKKTAGFFFLFRERTSTEEQQHWWHQMTTRAAVCLVLPPIWS